MNCEEKGVEEDDLTTATAVAVAVAVLETPRKNENGLNDVEVLSSSEEEEEEEQEKEEEDFRLSLRNSSASTDYGTDSSLSMMDLFEGSVPPATTIIEQDDCHCSEPEFEQDSGRKETLPEVKRTSSISSTSLWLDSIPKEEKQEAHMQQEEVEAGLEAEAEPNPDLRSSPLSLPSMTPEHTGIQAATTSTNSDNSSSSSSSFIASQKTKSPTAINPSLSYVTFDKVYIHSHEHIIGDNPGVTKGVPISISWKAWDSHTVTVDEYEGDLDYGTNNEHETEGRDDCGDCDCEDSTMSCPMSLSRPLSTLTSLQTQVQSSFSHLHLRHRQRRPHQFVLTKMQREQLLRKAGYSRQEIQDGMQAAQVARAQRQQTLQQWERSHNRWRYIRRLQQSLLQLVRFDFFEGCYNSDRSRRRRRRRQQEQPTVLYDRQQSDQLLPTTDFTTSSVESHSRHVTPTSVKIKHTKTHMPLPASQRSNKKTITRTPMHSLSATTSNITKNSNKKKDRIFTITTTSNSTSTTIADHHPNKQRQEHQHHFLYGGDQNSNISMESSFTTSTLQDSFMLAVGEEQILY